jgi:CBS domain-containing protein
MSKTVQSSAHVLEGVSVKDAMSRGVLSCSLETSLTTVAEMMAAHRVHCVVGFGDVTEDDTRLWGLVSDLDLVAVAAAEGLEGRTAGGCAATEVVTVGPHESLRRAAQLMSERGVSHLLVADPDSDRPVGVISTLDVADALAGRLKVRRQRGAMRVEHLMTPRVVAAHPAMPLKAVAALLVKHRISGVPVVRDGRVLGVVSERDILAKERGTVTEPGEGLLGQILGDGGDEIRRKLEARTAAEAMASPAITIEYSRQASAAATLMLERGVKRLPVLHDGKLVGILTRGDLVRAFARSDDEIERDIRQEVLLRSFRLAPDDIDVQVRGGEVTLRGKAETELLAELRPQEVQRVPGVVAVHSELTTHAQ